MIEGSLKTPFMTVILGVEVEVVRIKQGENGHIAAICRRGREARRILILDLPIPSPRPGGSEWIDAYRAWAQESY